MDQHNQSFIGDDHSKFKKPKLDDGESKEEDRQTCYLSEDVTSYIYGMHERIVSKEMKDTSVSTSSSSRSISKFDLLSPLFRKLFDGTASVSATKYIQVKSIPKEKSTQLHYQASTSKIVPCQPRYSTSVKFVTESPTLKVNYYSTEPKISKDARYGDLVKSMYSLGDLLNRKDLSGIDLIIKDVVIENCKFQTPALKEPLTGRHHILEMYKSIFRVWGDFNVKFINHEEEEIGGLITLTSNYIITGYSYSLYILHWAYSYFSLIFRNNNWT